MFYQDSCQSNVRLLLRLTSVCLFFLALAWHFTASAKAVEPLSEQSPAIPQDEQPPLPPAAPECTLVSAIPVHECNTLVAFFLDAGGEQWDNRSSWRDTTNGVTPCNWFGITCQNGHVARIDLSSNRLRGKITRFLGYLNQLSHLNVADNQLRQPLPGAICLLAQKGGGGDFSYNQLAVENRNLRQCLTTLDADWRDTQTVPPTNLRATTISNTQIALTWEPIGYTGDSGHYEVSYATVITGQQTLHGVTANKLTTSYTITGLTPGKDYYLFVRSVTLAHAAQENDQRSEPRFLSAVTAANEKVLVMVYFPADNNLSPYTRGVLRRLQAGTQLNPTATVLFLVDGRGDHNTALFEIAGGVITRTTAVSDTWGVDELDTMDPTTLAWFLDYGRSHYPANRSVVIMMGHGAGMTPEFGWLANGAPGQPPELKPGIPPLPRDIPPTPGDETNAGGFLSPIDYGRALNAATNNGVNPFDVVFFDHCFGGNLDLLYQVRNTAKVYIASPNYAWLAAPYRAYLSVLAPIATPEEMAQRIINIYQSVLNNQHPNVIFWLHNQDITTLATQISNLGIALSSALDNGQAEVIGQAALRSQFVDTNQCGRQNLVLEPPDELMGAGSFATNLRSRFPNGSAVFLAADAVLNTLSGIERRTRVGSPYIAPETEWDFTNTVTILAPLTRTLPSNVIWRASTYTLSAPLDAIWSPSPTQTVRISESLAFVRDGQWDEFIDKWYDQPLSPTVGEWCEYMGPVINTEDISETLTLSITVSGADLRLDWSASSHDNVLEYWIFVRDARSLNWRVLDEVPLAKTTYLVASPSPGQPAAYLVLGQDGQGATLSASNIEEWMQEGSGELRVYLPVVVK